MIYKQTQLSLAQAYQVSRVEKPEGYTESLRAEVYALVDRLDGRLLRTSGTTSRPKELLYTVERLTQLQTLYISQVLLAFDSLALQTPAIYFLSGLKRDDSLSSALMRQPVAGWIMRVLLSRSLIYVEEVELAVERYSSSAIHIFQLMLTQPSLVAMANPSSLYLLLRRIREDWEQHRLELRALCAEPLAAALIKRFGRDAELERARLLVLLSKAEPPDPRQMFPKLRGLYCWDGGYVGPFLERLHSELSIPNLEHFPSFSLSTECVATQLYPRYFGRGGIPITSGLCYEFYQEQKPHVLLKPWELQGGERYVMLVSDGYGLRRYDTADLFHCLELRWGLPMLEFVGRTGQQFSFTGEKLTAEQLVQCYAQLLEEPSPIQFDTCFPSRSGDNLPHYVFVSLSPLPPTDSASLASRIDTQLSQLNFEYASKRQSERLGVPRVVSCSLTVLYTAMVSANPQLGQANLGQFKLLPLHKLYWEDLGI